MKWNILFFFLICGCVTMGIRGSGDYFWSQKLKKEIENHGSETPEETGFGFSFGIGAFHPEYFLIRGKFSQSNFLNSGSSFYTQEGWLEGGIPVLRNKFFAFYPVVGFGAEDQIVKLKKRFEKFTYGVSLGFENHFILTKERPGYLALVFGANFKRIAGTFLDAPKDFIISPPHSRFQIFLGIEMGYIYEE